MPLPFLSVTRTDEEVSVVIPQEAVEADWQAEGDWRALKVSGPLDFNLTGVLAALAQPLAGAGIPMGPRCACASRRARS